MLTDTYLFISFLLTPRRDTPPATILAHALAGTFTLLVVQPLLDELAEEISTKPYLASRTKVSELDSLLRIMVSISEPIAEMSAPIPSVCRDPDDDYLIAHALMGNADYLVSGDRDLLALDPIGPLRILSPRDFVDKLASLE